MHTSQLDERVIVTRSKEKSEKYGSPDKAGTGIEKRFRNREGRPYLHPFKPDTKKEDTQHERRYSGPFVYDQVREVSPDGPCPIGDFVFYAT